jgi:hypothetical protein
MSGGGTQKKACKIFGEIKRIALKWARDFVKGRGVI